MRLGQVLEARLLMWTAAARPVRCLPINIVQISGFRKRKSGSGRFFVNYDKILCKLNYVNLYAGAGVCRRFGWFSDYFVGQTGAIPLHIGRAGDYCL